MACFGAFFVEETRVFNRDAGFTREDAHQLEMPLVEHALVFGKNCYDTDGLVVSDKRYAAIATSLLNWFDAQLFDRGDVILSNQYRLARADDVLGDVVACTATARGIKYAANYFNIEPHFVAKRIERADIKILHVKETAELFPNFAKKIFLV